MMFFNTYSLVVLLYFECLTSRYLPFIGKGLVDTYILKNCTPKLQHYIGVEPHEPSFDSLREATSTFTNIEVNIIPPKYFMASRNVSPSTPHITLVYVLLNEYCGYIETHLNVHYTPKPPLLVLK